MNFQSSSESNSDNTNPNIVNEISEQITPKQFLDLKKEVEQIYRDVDVLRKLIQTLVTGLVIAIFLALGISSWFAYRLLVQETITKQKEKDTTTFKTEMSEQINTLEQKFELQSQQINLLKQQIPNDLTIFIQENQTQLQELNNRIQVLEKSQQNSSKKASTKN